VTCPGAPEDWLEASIYCTDRYQLDPLAHLAAHGGSVGNAAWGEKLVWLEAQRIVTIARLGWDVAPDALAAAMLIMCDAGAEG
jgi:hypothetical protein